MYLDDIRNPKTNGWIVVRSYTNAVNWMEMYGCPDYISFDHDLGEGVFSGYDLAKWVVNKDLDEGGNWIPEYFDFNVHSANPVGAKNIQSLIERYLDSK